MKCRMKMEKAMQAVMLEAMQAVMMEAKKDPQSTREEGGDAVWTISLMMKM